MIGKYNPKTGRIEWFNHLPINQIGSSAAIEGVKEIRAVGLPGNPVFTSRKSYERAVKEAGCVVVGNDPSAKIGGQNDK